MRRRAAQHVGVDRAGGDRDHVDAQRSPLDRERLGQAADSEFTDDIGRHPRELLRAGKSAERAQVDDHAAAARDGPAVLTEKLAAAQERAAQVRRHRRVPVGGRELRERAAEEHGRVVDQDLDGPEAPARRGEGGTDEPLVGNVSGQREDPCARASRQAPRDLVERRLRAAHENHRVARGAKLLRARRADAAARARDQDDPRGMVHR